MAQTPEDIEATLDQMREVLTRWAMSDIKGEVAIVRGGNQLQVEERPIFRHPPVKRATRGQSALTIT